VGAAVRIKRSEINFLGKAGFTRYHRPSNSYWTRRNLSQYIDRDRATKQWSAIHSTGGPAGRYWRGPLFVDPVSAYVHAELENWGEP